MFDRDDADIAFAERVERQTRELVDPGELVVAAGLARPVTGRRSWETVVVATAVMIAAMMLAVPVAIMVGLSPNTVVALATVALMGTVFLLAMRRRPLLAVLTSERVMVYSTTFWASAPRALSWESHRGDVSWSGAEGGKLPYMPPHANPAGRNLYNRRRAYSGLELHSPGKSSKRVTFFGPFVAVGKVFAAELPQHVSAR
jgi:hypothetical protein